MARAVARSRRRRRRSSGLVPDAASAESTEGTEGESRASDLWWVGLVVFAIVAGLVAWLPV